jgi:hypothetical protein
MRQECFEETVAPMQQERVAKGERGRDCRNFLDSLLTVDRSTSLRLGEEG